MSLKCPKCNHEYQSNATKCEHCGEVFEDLAQPEIPKKRSFIDKFFSVIEKRSNHANTPKSSRLPVFFMTLIGVVTLLFGFGYLMQYSLTRYFLRIALEIKLVFGFSTSLAIFLIGAIFRQSKKYREYGFVVFGLSISMNYLLIYFLPYLKHLPFWSSATMGFSLVVLNTVFATALALLNQSRIMTAICFIGGAASPFILQQGNLPQHYLIFLFILVSCTMYVTQSIKWWNFTLAIFAGTMGIVQFLIMRPVFFVEPVFLPLYIHAFAYLFMYFVLFQKRYATAYELEILAERKINLRLNTQLRTIFDYHHLIIAVVAQIFLIFNFFYYSRTLGTEGLLGRLFFANSLPALFVFFATRYKSTTEARLILLIIGGTFLGLAAYSTLTEEYMGGAWAMEALIIIAIGFKYRVARVRKIGYVFLLLSLVKILSMLRGLNDGWEESIFNDAYINLLAIGGILFLFISILNRFYEYCKNYELALQKIVNENFSIWFVLVYMLTAFYYSFQYLAFLTIVPAYLLIYWGYTTKLNYTKILGYFLYVGMIIFASYIAITDLQENINQTIRTPGYYNLLGIGLFIFTLRYWYLIINAIDITPNYIRVKEMRLRQSDGDDIFFKKEFVSLLTKIFYIWLCFAFILTTKHFTGTWLSYWNLVIAYFLIYKGYFSRFNFIKYLGYILYFILLINAFFNSMRDMQLGSEAQFPNAYFDLLMVGFFIITLRIGMWALFKIKTKFSLFKIKSRDVVPHKWNLDPFRGFYYNVLAIIKTLFSFRFGFIPISVAKPKNIQILYNVFWNILAVWFAITFFITVYLYIPEYSVNLLVIPMFALIFFGGKKKLTFTELLGLSHYAFLVIGLVAEFYKVGTIRLSVQTTSTLILLVEVYGILWFLKLFYQKFLFQNPRLRYMSLARDLFSIAFPLVIIFIASRRLPLYLPYAVWVSVAMSYIIAQITKNKTIIAEFYALLIIACFLSFRHSNFYYISTGGIVIATILTTKFGWFNRIKNWPPLRYFPEFVYYYSAAWLFFAYNYFIRIDYITASFVTAFYLFALVYLRRIIFPIRISYLIAYRTAYALFLYALYLFFDNSFTTKQMQDWQEMLPTGIFMTLSFIILYKLIYEHHFTYSISGLLRKSRLLPRLIKFKTSYPGKVKSGRWRFELKFMQLMYILAYAGTILYLSPYLKNTEIVYADEVIEVMWNTAWVTVLLFAHGIIIMLKSISPRFESLMPMAILTFATALVKLFMFDLSDFSMLQRVIVFMVIGMLFLGATYLYIDIKERESLRAQGIEPKKRKSFKFKWKWKFKLWNR